MVQTTSFSVLRNKFLTVAYNWLTTSFSRKVVAQEEYLILNGLVWTKSRSRLLSMSVEAARQGWCNKANTYIGELALNFDLDTYSLTRSFSESMSYFGYSEEEISMLCNWISGYRTGINNYIRNNEYP